MGVSMSAASLFQLQSARIGYASHIILQDLNLRIAPGEKLAVLGESGAGKSTLLRHLRSLRPQAVAWCPQQPGLVPMLSVFHNLYMGQLDQHSIFYNFANLCYPFPTPRREISALALTLGLQDKLWASVEALSGGQQSRVNLGRALYQRRSIFIGDEPVSAVDELQADQLLAMICRQHDTVIIALHDVELALRHCSRVIGLQQGKIVLDCLSSQVNAGDLLRLYA